MPTPHLLLADLGLHVVGLGYQQSVSEHVALQADVDLWVPWTQELDQVASDATGVVLRLRPVWFPRGHAPTGFWASPFGQAGPAKATSSGEPVTGFGWAAGVSAGGAWILAKHLHIAVGAGVQVDGAGGFLAKVPPGSTVDPAMPGPGFGPVGWPHVDGTIGYAW